MLIIPFPSEAASSLSTGKANTLSLSFTVSGYCMQRNCNRLPWQQDSPYKTPVILVLVAQFEGLVRHSSSPSSRMQFLH